MEAVGVRVRTVRAKADLRVEVRDKVHMVDTKKLVFLIGDPEGISTSTLLIGSIDKKFR